MSTRSNFFAACWVTIIFCYGTAGAGASDAFSHFVGFESFSHFKKSKNEKGEAVLVSPEIKSPIPWNELVVSWNAEAEPGTFVKVEARAIFSDHTTPFYSMGVWSPDNKKFVRGSVRGQKDADAKVDTDTLILNKLGQGTQLRVTLGGEAGLAPKLKFLGASFSDTKAPTATLAPNKKAWGKIIPTPEHSQHGYPDEQGWCSPTSVSMVLTRWSEVLHRPEMKLDVPEVAAKVYDQNWDATGNWPFNTAYAGSFKKMRSYVTRFSDLSEVEDWVAAGIPVILSARWNLLKEGRNDSGSGHLITCIGFTENGDVVINDPAGNPARGTKIQNIYKRENVLKAWATSHNTVYLVYPESAKVPKDRFGHWDK